MSDKDRSVNVAEFLYCLVEMIEHEDEKIIEWCGGKLIIQDPPKLESDILSDYFGHSNYSSFQRQLTNFGFHKIWGRGKMARCCYKNRRTTLELNSILTLKVRNFYLYAHHRLTD